MKMIYMIIAFTFSTHKRERKGKKKTISLLTQVKIHISRLHFRLLPIYVKWTSLSSLNGCLSASYVMSCLIIFYHLYVVLKRNTHRSMQIVYILIRHHMYRGLSFHAGTTFLDIFGLSFFPKRIDMNRFCLTSQTYACQIKHRTSHFDVTFELT